ncbi:TBC1 domain member 20 [Mycena chlorophos]|uniref:TBC1 domain member 20 n=1 Tax=Mycena chlorophos TaxID=658473 RepID=A0A8H6T047_MYCCL|nr:TBC1 domain member 20 [Mycena chlorophos]
MASEKPPPPTDDWAHYRALSLHKGGFGDERVEIWPKLLHARPTAGNFLEASTEMTPHPDERQIRLDTERSFVLYPVDSPTDKERLQTELHELLVQIFRKRPRLNYFQGYHDIITVLLLTLPPELQLSCAEHMSLQRVRDSMGSTLEPVLGLLRVMRNLVRIADPEYAELLERTSPLPYYALPNLLTLFSHDFPTLPLIQHAFDYLLCRPPIFVVYLATAIILSRKNDVERLEEEGEEGMLHSLLSALPDLVDDESDVRAEEEVVAKEESSPIPVDEEADTETETKSEDEYVPSVADHSEASELPADDPPTYFEPSSEHEEADDPSPTPPPPPPRRKPKPKPQILTALLVAADALHESYPSTYPALHLSSIMGPQSVVYTWSPHTKDMPSADEAERMVQRPDLIVYPEPPPPEPEKKPAPRRTQARSVTNTGLLVGAGLVLGVAIAVSVYGARHNSDPARELRKVGQWVGGFVAGVTEKIVH